jgi:heme exporter protein A
MLPLLLEGTNLACYRGEIALFEGLDLRVEAGEALRIEGANGTGKTSLLRILAGLSRPDEGKVEWSGTDIHARPLGFNAVLGFLGA